MRDPIGRIIAGDAPVFLLVAGPNGAGKSTFSKKTLKPLGIRVIDPDAVALEMFGRHPCTKEEALSATKEATRQALESLTHKQSVVLESVFSDEGGYKLDLLDRAGKEGFRTVLAFIGSDSPDLCIARIVGRVSDGGHDVPDDKIIERYPKCFRNLIVALDRVDLTILIDNTGAQKGMADEELGARHYLFATIEKNGLVDIRNPTPNWFYKQGVWDAINKIGRP